MDKIAECLKTYIDTHPFDSGDSEAETVLDQIYQAYAESHESDPTEIGDGFKDLEKFLESLPLEDNNAAFNLCCRRCSAYERKAFMDGVHYGVHLSSKECGVGLTSDLMRKSSTASAVGDFCFRGTFTLR